MDQAAVFARIFAGEGAVRVTWEVATRCSCWTEDSHQPGWDHQPCGGLGVLHAPAVTIPALFRAQSRWQARHSAGEFGLGDAQITTQLEHRPGFTDSRVRDRYTVVDAPSDAVQGRVFHPAGQAVPFVFAGVQRAWRVQVQGLDQSTRVKPQP
jgi:hypothetical protein